MLIGELADRTGASARSLRYYEQQGLLSPGRTVEGYRVYGEDAVGQVRRIKVLLTAGFSSAAVAALLPCVDGDTPVVHLCPQVEAEMRRTLAGIEEDLATLTGQRDAVQALLGQRSSRSPSVSR